MMVERSIIKQVKRIPVMFSILLTLYFGMNIYRCIESVGKTRILNVSVYRLKERTYKDVDLGENNFQTGTEGKLYWKVKNVREAFLVNLGEVDGVFSFITLLYFIILNGALYLMLWGITEETIFSERLSDGLIIIVYVIIFYSFISLVSQEVSETCIKKLTNGQFTSQYRKPSLTTFMLFAFLMLFIPPFIKKAKKLQQEKDLTI